MKNIFVSFAKYNQEADGAILAILKKMPLEEREKDRGSYYGSLSALYRHVLGGTAFFCSLFKASLSPDSPAVKALAPLAGFSHIEGAMNEAQWLQLEAAAAEVDGALTAFCEALTEDELNAPVKVQWYGGNPASVPLYFMLQNLTAHGTHHRGQISQILDSLKIDNDYSGINVKFI
jgi:uncharacterized damage-inducible protein DinB